jgi:hypothetical protein
LEGDELMAKKRVKDKRTSRPGAMSPSHPVVPVTDETGLVKHFGSDENDRPLVPMRPDQEVAEDLKQKPYLKKTYTGLPTPPPKRTECDCGQPLCRLCNPESAKLGVVDIVDIPMQPSSAKPPKETTFKAPLVGIGSYRSVLGLEMVDIANIFDEDIYTLVRADAPTLDKGTVEAELNAVKTQILKVTDDLKTRTARYQKIKRPDDPIPEKRLRQLRREETRELKNLKEKQTELQSRLRSWESDARGRVVVNRFEKLYPITYQESRVEWGWYEDSFEDPLVKGGTPLCGDHEIFFGDVYDITGYRALIADAPVTKNWKATGWAEWENRVILQAIDLGLIEVDKKVLLAHPKLRRRSLSVDEIEIDHDHERVLIKKTGGGALGGASIFSRGYRGGNLRHLESFDATMHKGRGKGEPGGSYEPETDYPSVDNDSESFDPD